MSITRISSRYAKSLLDLAIERNEMDTVYQDMLLLKEMFSNRDLYLLLKSPIVNATKKHSIFKTLFADKLSKTTNAFLDIVVTKGREQYLPEIVNEGIAQYKEIKKISTVYLTTAEVLTAKQLEEIKAKLLATNVTLDSIEFITKVDPNIIGGYIVQIGDNLYDSSVKYSLAQLRKEFLDNKYIKAI
ncbi:MAG: ATP synthase F1 subunit delta [Saprospiraceae bacterium]